MIVPTYHNVTVKIRRRGGETIREVVIVEGWDHIPAWQRNEIAGERGLRNICRRFGLNTSEVRLVSATKTKNPWPAKRNTDW